jgi:TRAP-type C4-dicarboxylate transport system permease small subunit
MTALLEAGARVSRWLAWLGGALLLLSAALVSLDVIFRSLWKVSYFESFELSTYAFAIATALGMSYALVSKAHIRIELLYVLLPLRARAWLDVLAYGGLAVVAGALLYYCGLTVWGNVQSGARSNSSLSLPLAIPQGLWLLGLAWFALLALACAVFGLWQVLRGRHELVQQRLGVAALQDEIQASVAAPGERC